MKFDPRLPEPARIPFGVDADDRHDRLVEQSTSSIERIAIRKASFRLLPLVFIIYLVAFLDRANVAYAKLTMARDLNFSETVYGLGAGLFFIGYLILEIPGALIVHRWGARRWIARILATWGLCTVLVGFVRTAHEFYLARFLLGLAEAGLVPGVVIYLHEWFPALYRARALAKFFIASTVALAIGGPIAGLILKLQWLGIPGWRWLFILEGIPAIVLAVINWFVMVDRPDQAAWLTIPERDYILNALAIERQQKSISHRASILRTLCSRDVLLLSAVGFLSNIGIAGFFLWLPSTLHNASDLSPSGAAILSGIPFAGAVVSVLCMSYSSDRTGERYLHTAIPLILAALIFPVTTMAGLSFIGLVCWLCLSAAAIYGFGPAYWTLPAQKLEAAPGAAAFGFLNLSAGLGSFVGPVVVGSLLTAKVPFSIAVMFLSACFLLAGICALALRSFR
jgi:ACS family tartrate transporter-like MFS transporter